MIELILGGARSGKSRFAERRAAGSNRRKLLIATAQAGDAEMAARIERHKQTRDADWTVIEEPLHLADVLSRHAHTDHCLLVDCLTLWLTNLLHSPNAQQWQQERDKLIEAIPDLPGDIILIGNEVGTGIIPMGAITRRFVDENGRLHQELAAVCDRVTLITAGLPLELKREVTT